MTHTCAFCHKPMPESESAKVPTPNLRWEHNAYIHNDPTQCTPERKAQFFASYRTPEDGAS